MSDRRFSPILAHKGSPALTARLYRSTAIGLAAFLCVIILYREPLGGYLVELEISGPPMTGLDLNDAGDWSRRADPAATLEVLEPNASNRTHLLLLRRRFSSTKATAQLAGLASRWLRQRLPEQLSKSRQQTLAGLRDVVAVARHD